MGPQVAVFVRETEDHIFFRFAQEPTVEGFCDIGVAAGVLSEGDLLIVEMLEPGVWFVSDPTSLAV